MGRKRIRKSWTYKPKSARPSFTARKESGCSNGDERGRADSYWRICPLLLKQWLCFLQSAHKSLARRQGLRITKSIWLSDWYCGKRVKSTNCCAKGRWFNFVRATQLGLALSQWKRWGRCPASKWWHHGTAQRETSKSRGTLFGFSAFRASRRCPRLNLPTDKWGNGTGCGSANKRFWGFLRRWCKWFIKVIQTCAQQ